MVVLSLFDGISCGYLALKRVLEGLTVEEIKIDKYFASEVDNSAIKIATTNNPEIIEIGDVRKVSYNKKRGILSTENGDFSVEHIDLLIGGSPCTDFSSIGLSRGMVAEDKPILDLETYLQYKREGYTFTGYSYLFWEYMRILNEIQPNYFLLENVLMAKKWRNLLTETIGYAPIEINSELVSAQWRRRLYWTNIPFVDKPEDKHIILDDILDSNADTKDCMFSAIVKKNLPNLVVKYSLIPKRFNAYNAVEITDKACTLTTGSRVSGSSATLQWVKLDKGEHIVKEGILDNIYPVDLEDGRYNLRCLSLLEMERLQTLPDNYTNIEGLSASARGKCIGNGWTVDVIKHILSYIPFDQLGQ